MQAFEDFIEPLIGVAVQNVVEALFEVVQSFRVIRVLRIFGNVDEVTEPFANVSQAFPDITNLNVVYAFTNVDYAFSEITDIKRQDCLEHSRDIFQAAVHIVALDSVNASDEVFKKVCHDVPLIPSGRPWRITP